MSSKDILELKISSVQKYLKLLKKLSKHSFQIIENDPILKGAVERYLYLAVHATIELAEAVIAFKDFRRPSTYREAFEILEEEELINLKLVDQLKKMTGFRNAIAHDYESFDSKKTYDILKNDLQDIEKFLKIVEKKIL